MKNSLDKAFKDAGKAINHTVHEAADVAEKVVTNPDVQDVAKEVAIGVAVAAITAA
jgi:hypothetical protein